jgi:hypothetical protein
MATRKAVAGKPALDPTLPNVPLVLNGRTLFLAFDFNAIATAESVTGLELLNSIDLQNLNAGKFRALLYSALLKAQPDITIEEVGSMINFTSLPAITVALVHAWTGSQPEIVEANKETANPPVEQPDQN